HAPRRPDFGGGVLHPRARRAAEIEHALPFVQELPALIDLFELVNGARGVALFVGPTGVVVGFAAARHEPISLSDERRAGNDLAGISASARHKRETPAGAFSISLLSSGVPAPCSQAFLSSQIPPSRLQQWPRSLRLSGSFPLLIAWPRRVHQTSNG